MRRDQTVKVNVVQVEMFATSFNATGTHVPYRIAVLPATWQKWHFHLYLSQLKPVLDLEALEECKLSWLHTEVVHLPEDGQPS